MSWWKSHPEKSQKALTLGDLLVRKKLIEGGTRIEGTYRDVEGRKPAGAHGDALSCSKPDARKSSAWGKGVYVDANRVGHTGRPPPVEHSMDRWAIERGRRVDRTRVSSIGSIFCASEFTHSKNG